MGLLDNLYLGHNSSFGGQGGGLLDFLRNTQMQQDQYQPSQGFGNPMDANAQSAPAAPINIGGYQMPRIGGAQAFTPDPAAIPQTAQPTQGQIPPQPQAMGGDSYIDRINSGGSLIGSLFGPPQSNQTAQFLISRGVDPAAAKAIVSDPALLRSVLPQIMGTGGQTDDIKEYQFAKQEDPTLTFNKFMQQKKAVSGEFSLTPQYGTNEKGETVLIQTGKSGEAIQTKLPAGVKISSGVEKIDLGTEWGLYDRRSGQMVGKQAKDIAGEKRAEAVGKGLGTADVDLASIRSKMPGLETVVKKLDELSEKATYTIAGQAVDWANRQVGAEPRDAAIARADYVSMVDNQVLPLLRDTFGAAFTQKEGESLRATLGDPDKSPKEKQAVLRSFIEQKRRDVEALEARTGAAPAAAPAASSPAPSSPPPPKAGDVQGGYRFKGGNPADKKNWEPIS